jgi:hypothetical protein
MDNQTIKASVIVLTKLTANDYVKEEPAGDHLTA